MAMDNCAGLREGWGAVAHRRRRFYAKRSHELPSPPRTTADSPTPMAATGRLLRFLGTQASGGTPKGVKELRV